MSLLKRFHDWLRPAPRPIIVEVHGSVYGDAEMDELARGIADHVRRSGELLDRCGPFRVYVWNAAP